MIDRETTAALKWPRLIVIGVSLALLVARPKCVFAATEPALDAGFLFGWATSNLGAHWPASADELNRTMVEFGFKRIAKLQWSARDSSGETQVSCVPEAGFAQISFAPRRVVPVAPELLRLLGERCKRFDFDGPDEVELGFDGEIGDAKYSDAIILRMPLGSWRLTTRSLKVAKSKP